MSSRLHDSAKKYKDALAAMIKHQESFARVLLEVYQPISGRFPTVQPTQTQTEFSTLGSHHITKKDRPVTPEASLKRAQDFLASSARITEILIPKLDIIVERQVIKPSQDYLDIHKKVAKTIVKRDHKKID